MSLNRAQKYRNAFGFRFVILIDVDPTVTAVLADAGTVGIRRGVGEVYVKNDNGLTTNWTSLVDMVGGQRQVFINAGYNANTDNYRVRNVIGGGGHRFSFHIPSDFVSLNSLLLVGIISAGAAGPGKDIDLFSNYALLGELNTQNAENDTLTTYDFTGLANRIGSIDLSVVFSNLQANHFCGVFVDHNGIGGAISYLGILLNYNIA